VAHFFTLCTLLFVFCFVRSTGNGHYAAAEPLIPSSTKSASGRDRQSEAAVTSNAAAVESNYQSSSV
jgi:hypothetical protein